MQAQNGIRRTRAKGVGHAAQFGRRGARYIADFKPHLDHHIVASVDHRLDFQLESHIGVVDRLGIAPGRRRGHGDEWNAVANKYLGLFAVDHPDAGIGQHIHIGLGILQIDRQRTEGCTDAAAIQIAQVVQRQPDRLVRGQRCQGKAVRPGHAKVAQLAAGDFQHLHFEHHLGLGHVMQGDHFFDHAQSTRGIPGNQHIELFVGHNIAPLEQGFKRCCHRFDIGVGHLKGAHAKFLVVLDLGRNIGINQQRVVIHHLLLQLVRQQQKIERRFHRAVAQDDGGFLVRLDILVKDKVEPRAECQHIKDLAQRGLFEVHRNRFAVGIGQRALQRCRRWFPRGFLQEGKCFHMVGVRTQQRVQRHLGLVFVARLQ